MTEAIKVLEKQLEGVRNQIRGCETRIASAQSNLDNETLSRDKLLEREIEFNKAIGILKGL